MLEAGERLTSDQFTSCKVFPSWGKRFPQLGKTISLTREKPGDICSALEVKTRHTLIDIKRGLQKERIRPLDENGGISRDALLTAREAELLGGGGLNGDVFLVSADDFGEASLHLGDIGIELGMLGTHRGIEIAKDVTFGGNQFDGLAEQNFAVDIQRLVGCIGEMITDVAHVGSTEKGVANSMNQHIGIAVAQQTHRMLYLNTAKP